MKKVIWSMAFILVLGIGSIGLAANSHTVNVTINSFARVSVTGSADVTIFEQDFVNGYANKDLNSTVQVLVRTNSKNGCKLSASASKDFSNTFPVSKLKAKVDYNGTSYQPLATTPVELVNFCGPQSNNYHVLFRLEELPETSESGNYKTTITYTVAANS